MNNACPSCGAVYAVAVKDIGRKIKCKKCNSALIVSDAGLEFDAPPAPPPATAVAVADEEDDVDQVDEIVVTKSKKDKKSKFRESSRGSVNFDGALTKMGGLPTVLFGFGVFLVILFTFQSSIGGAAVKRAAMGPKKLNLEMKNAQEAKLPKGKKSREELTDDERKIYDGEITKIAQEYAPKLREAEQDKEETEIDNVRSIRNDRYGVMFGFLFVAFGCIGYLRTEQPLVMRIVAGVILSFMMMVVFVGMSGCGADKGPSIPLG